MVTGVSAQRELIDRAVELGAQLVLVHHGLFWDFKPDRAVAGPGRARCARCSSHDVALAAYHLPLDAHAEVGNNAILCDTARL